MAAKKKMPDDPYERLANAIVIQAAEDYRAALKRIRRNPNNRDAVEEALQLERFFRSGWYQVLTSVDGEYMIQRLQEEIGQSE